MGGREVVNQDVASECFRRRQPGLDFTPGSLQKLIEVGAIC